MVRYLYKHEWKGEVWSRFSSKKEAEKFIPEIKKEIEESNPDAKVIFRRGK